MIAFAYQGGSGDWYIVEPYGPNGKWLDFRTAGHSSAAEAWCSYRASASRKA